MLHVSAREQRETAAPGAAVLHVSAWNRERQLLQEQLCSMCQLGTERDNCSRSSCAPCGSLEQRETTAPGAAVLHVSAWNRERQLLQEQLCSMWQLGTERDNCSRSSCAPCVSLEQRETTAPGAAVLHVAAWNRERQLLQEQLCSMCQLGTERDSCSRSSCAPCVSLEQRETTAPGAAVLHVAAWNRERQLLQERLCSMCQLGTERDNCSRSSCAPCGSLEQRETTAPGAAVLHVSAWNRERQLLQEQLCSMWQLGTERDNCSRSGCAPCGSKGTERDNCSRSSCAPCGS